MMHLWWYWGAQVATELRSHMETPLSTRKKTHLEIRDLDKTSATDMPAVATATVVQRTFSVTMLN